MRKNVPIDVREIPDGNAEGNTFEQAPLRTYSGAMNGNGKLNQVSAIHFGGQWFMWRLIDDLKSGA